MTQAITAGRVSAIPDMSVFERFLTVWVLLCIVAGIALGQFAPGVFQAIGRMEIAQVNLPVGLLIWVMIIPMLLKVDFGALGQLRHHWRGIGVTLATVVGVLIEVPVMLLVVRVVNRSRGWYECSPNPLTR
jgi:ACR3 family arsenite transporter